MENLSGNGTPQSETSLRIGKLQQKRYASACNGFGVLENLAEMQWPSLKPSWDIGRLLQIWDASALHRAGVLENYGKNGTPQLSMKRKCVALRSHPQFIFVNSDFG